MLFHAVTDCCRHIAFSHMAEVPISGTQRRYNPSSGERRWTKPPMPAPTLPPGWAAAKDPTTGQKYYYNTATGELASLV